MSKFCIHPPNWESRGTTSSKNKVTYIKEIFTASYGMMNKISEHVTTLSYFCTTVVLCLNSAVPDSVVLTTSKILLLYSIV